jgi:hypothetical protein
LNCRAEFNEIDWGSLALAARAELRRLVADMH